MNKAKGRTLTLVAIGALFAFLFALQFLGSGTLSDGAVAPALSLPRADRPGERIELSRLRGKIVVLDFWSTTCAPCMSQIKVLDALARRMSSRGVEVVGVSAGGESFDEVAAFLKRRGAPYSIVVDADGIVTDSYRVRGLPTLYIVDREGRIAASHVGFWPEDDLAEEVADTLGAASEDL
jgi:peroxiredoxin